MQSLSSRSIIGRVGRVASRWRLPALARRYAPVLMASVSAHPNKQPDLLFRHKNQISRLHRPGLCFSSATTQATDEPETKKAAEEETKEAAAEEIVPYHMEIMPGNNHRYGYRTRYEMKNSYYFDMADRTETPLDDPTCGYDPAHEYSMSHDLMQIFSLKLARAPAGSSGPVVQIYGYLAARDEVDYNLIYVFNRGRDDPVTVQQGSLIEMTGPKRPIARLDVLLEFDMRVKNGDGEDDDLRLIDGASILIGLPTQYRPQKVRLDDGDCGGAVDMCFANVDAAVGATVDVVVSEVQTGFDLSLSSVISFEEILGEFLQEEFQLFRGAVGESCALRRFVVAIREDTVMQLKFKIGRKGFSDGDIERKCSFRAQLKGYDSHQINLELASILVKVTWATLPIYIYT